MQGIIITNDVLVIGYYFNPQYQYGDKYDIPSDTEVMRGVRNVIKSIEPNEEAQIQALLQVRFQYVSKNFLFIYG